MSIQPNSAAAIHLVYTLKPSRSILVFQLCSLFILLMTFYQILSFAELLLLLLLALTSFFFFLKQDHIRTLAVLDAQDWTIQYAHSKTKHRVQIKKIIDQYFYVVVYFESRSIKPLLIWGDQLPKSAWKSIRIRSKLQ